MLKASDLATHPGGADEAIEIVRTSGLRCTGLQVLRDFEGVSGCMQTFKEGIAAGMIAMCAAVGSPVLLCCSSTSRHACGDAPVIVRDLRRLARLAEPYGVNVAYEALSWGRTVREITLAWRLVAEANCPNLGIGLDSFHLLATNTPLEALESLIPAKIFLVQLSDLLWPEIHSVDERIATARHFRVFPGEGAHNDLLARLCEILDRLGYEGDFSLEVLNDDYLQFPLSFVAQRARRSARWLQAQVPGGVNNAPLQAIAVRHSAGVATRHLFPVGQAHDLECATWLSSPGGQESPAAV